MIAIETLVMSIVWLLVLALVLGLVWWLISFVESRAQKYNLAAPAVFDVIRIIFVIAVVIILIGFLMHLIGYPLVRFDSVRRL